MNSWEIILYLKPCLSQDWLMFAAEIWNAGSVHGQEYTLKPRNSVYKATLLRIDEDIFSAHCHIMYVFLNIYLHFSCFSDSHCLLMLSVLNGRIKFKLQASVLLLLMLLCLIPCNKNLQRTECCFENRLFLFIYLILVRH